MEVTGIETLLFAILIGIVIILSLIVWVIRAFVKAAEEATDEEEGNSIFTGYVIVSKDGVKTIAESKIYLSKQEAVTYAWGRMNVSIAKITWREHQ